MFLSVLGGVALLLVMIPVYFFVRSLFKDPAVPEMVKVTWDTVQGKALSNLSGADVSAGEARSSRRREDDEVSAAMNRRKQM